MKKETKERIKNILIGVGIGTGLGGLAAIPIICAINGKHNSGIWSDFTESGGPKFYNNDITKMVKEHSSFWDRLNPGRMVDMSSMAFDILSGSVEAPEKENWKFTFGKDGGINTCDWR